MTNEQFVNAEYLAARARVTRMTVDEIILEFRRLENELAHLQGQIIAVQAIVAGFRKT